MTDWVDWREWMDDALFEAMISLRHGDWDTKAADRKALVESFEHVQSVAAMLNDYAPRVEERPPLEAPDPEIIKKAG